MTHKTHFELVSPEEKLLSEDVTMITIPGTEGDFGVLNGHMPLVASIRTGIIKVYRDNMKDVSERIFIAGGVADVTGTQCTVLAEQAVNVNDLNKDHITSQIASLETQINVAEDEVERNRFHKRLAILQAMLQAA